MPVDVIEKNLVLLHAIEATEGVAPTLDAATGLWVSEMKSPKLNEKTIKRDYSTQARPLDIVEQAVMQWWDFDFKVPYSYSGTAGTPSPLEKIFLMCGAAETVVATTSVTYARETARGNFDSAALEFRSPLEGVNTDLKRQVSGARGQLGFKIALNEDIVFSCKGIGSYARPAMGMKIAPTYGTQQTNIFGAPKVSLITAKTLNAKALCLHSVEATNFFCWDLEWLEECGGERASPKGAPGEGLLKIQMAMPDWNSEFNPYTYASRAGAHQRLPFEFSIGSAAGKKLSIKVDEVQCGKPSEVALPNGMLGMEMELKIVHNPVIIER